MPEALHIHINGQARSFAELPTTTLLDRLIDVLGLKADRIAVEHNGEIAPRATWSSVSVQNGDKLEIVHFVGGGSA